MVRSAMTTEEKEEIWRRYRAGASPRSIDRALGRSGKAVWDFVASTGGNPARGAVALSAAAVVGGARRDFHVDSSRTSRAWRSPVAWVALRPRSRGRSPVTAVGYGPSRGGGPGCLAGGTATEAAKLVVHRELAVLVADKLRLRWSPQQIAAWLRREHPADPELQVSHETIYTSLFVQSRGALRRELTAYLRMRRVLRRPRATRPYHHGSGKLRDTINISERPPEVADRAVPGHWEGDLLLGSGGSPIVTRSSAPAASSS